MLGFTAENALYASGSKCNMPSSATERSSSGSVPQAGASQARTSLGPLPALQLGKPKITFVTL
jgi:hypothetical protein